MSQKHRGQHPSDFKLFTPKTLLKIKAGIEDYSWLLSRGYAEKSALKLVGDRFLLKERQRKAIQRCACKEDALKKRQQTLLQPKDLKGQTVWIDGFNLLITLESALSGGLIFKGKDGCFRDLASIHGTYKKVMETEKAIELTGLFLEKWEVGEVLWLLDKPVSNSGRLKVALYEMATTKGWNWQVDLFFNPDKELMECDKVVVSSDSLILDHSERWANLGRWIVEEALPDAKVIRF